MPLNNSRHPARQARGTPHTTEVLQQMSYVGGMNYAKARLEEATAPRQSVKGKQTRPPALLAQTSATGQHGDSCSSSPSSKAASARSSAYNAVHQAAKAGKALLEAQVGVKQAASQLSERRARCAREHQATVEEIEAVQNELRSSTKRQEQGQHIQIARMDAMGYQMAEMKDLIAQREVRMEAQMQEVCTQFQAMGSLLKNIQPRSTGNTIKNLLQDTEVSLPKPTKNVTLKSTEDTASIAKLFGTSHHSTKYPPQNQPHSISIEPASTSRHVPPTAAPSKREPISETITFETSSMGITALREPTHTVNQREPTNTGRPTGTVDTANATLGETATEYHTADNELPPGNPCASSTG